MNLYELSNEYLSLMDDIEHGVLDEEAIEQAFASLEGELNTKIEHITIAIKNASADARAIDEEIKNLQDRKRSKENLSKRLTEYLSVMLQRMEMPKFETPKVLISFRKSEAVEVADEIAVINRLVDAGRMDLLSVKEPSLNKAEIKKVLKAGGEIPGVSLVTRNNIQIK